MSVKSNKSGGFTLIEVLVTVGIIAIFCTIVAGYIKNVSGVAAKNNAQIGAQQESAEIIALLKKDMTFINSGNSNAVAASGPSLTLDTVSANLAYTSACQPAPSSLANLNFSAAQTAGCLPGGACGAGQVPTLTVTRPNNQATKVYPEFLSGGGGSAQHPVGAMACFSTASGFLTVSLTNFYLDLNRNVVALNKQLTFPLNSTPGIQINR